ncbi:MAG: prepilin peptidase [Phenylobacterium sp.]|uniref:A24 family peptidase n=1 Tax=Brevundimonas sp. TaxID=1871086 RepID=UPI002737DD2D|nr:prepilin peptidase [Brevundimonas sp.]MDP3803273.1 prepilin peptidase [Brevundimonas sp.]MDZ4375313.1 prepilin peptidase [Phenylobacterium sp.]
MDSLTLILLGVMPALVIVAGLKDLISMKIPNWISGLIVLAFFPAALVVGLDLATVATNIGLAVLALLVGAGMFALRWIGGGDAKLMAATCLWLGLAGSGMFLLWTGVMGGLFCLVLIFARVYSRPYLLGAPGWIVQLMEPKGDIPYGVAIAAGALMAYPASPLLAAFIAG